VGTIAVNFKYTLPDTWIEKVAQMEEFANGATQVSVKTKSGAVIENVLISNSKHIVAVRGYRDLPFSIDDIVEIFQTNEDKNPQQRGNWEFWDNWLKPSKS
jgi:hypothetical protein